MNDDRAAELLITPGANVLLMNAPIGYAKKLGPLPAGATVTDKRGPADVVLAFVRDSAELKRLATSFGALEEGATLWVCYPTGGTKAGTDLDRATLHAVMEKHELTGEAVLEVDSVWTAMRFRAPEDADSE